MSTNTSFFDNARKYRSNYKDEKDWARHFARVYFHEVDNKPGFLTIYQSLLSAQDAAPVHVKSSTKAPARVSKANQRSVTAEENTLRITVRVSDAKPDAVFAKDGRQTDAEERKGKYELNKFLYKAYADWYHAFEDEVADENASGSRTNDMSVDDRWSWHAAKGLSRKSGVPADTIFPVVQAWLIQRG
jgi:hypothetical protein